MGLGEKVMAWATAALQALAFMAALVTAGILGLCALIGSAKLLAWLICL